MEEVGNEEESGKVRERWMQVKKIEVGVSRAERVMK